MNVLTWIIFSLVIVVSYLYLSGTSGYDGASGTVEPPPPPPTLFDRNSRPPPPKLFSRKRDMGGPWRGMMPQKICIDIT